MIRLGQEPTSWGPTIAIGAVSGILAAFAAAYAVAGIATSDQSQARPGLGLILIASAPVLVAIGSALVLGRAYGHRRDATP